MAYLEALLPGVGDDVPLPAMGLDVDEYFEALLDVPPPPPESSPITGMAVKEGDSVGSGVGSNMIGIHVKLGLSVADPVPVVPSGTALSVGTSVGK